MAYIKDRGNGHWLVTISNGYNSDGSKRTINFTVAVDARRTKEAQRKEVVKIANARETDLDRGLITAGKKITIAALAEEFLALHCSNLAINTVSHYKYILEHKIIPELGKKAVQDLRPRDINLFYRKLKDTPALSRRSKTGKLSGESILHCHRILRSMLTYAVHAGYISINPALSAEAPRKDTPEVAFYEYEDCEKLFAAIDAQPSLMWRLFFYMAIYTGLRPEELIGLNWSDIGDNALTVRAGAAYVKGRGTIRTDRPKTHSSIRTLNLQPYLIQLLQQYRQEQAEYKLKFGTGWPEPDAVFTGEAGHRLNISSPTQKFQKIIKKYKLRPITLYGLRHTNATIMYAQGLNVRDVSARLGHAQPSTTLNTYVHVLNDANTRATNAIGEVLDNIRALARANSRQIVDNQVRGD